MTKTESDYMDNFMDEDGVKAVDATEAAQMEGGFWIRRSERGDLETLLKLRDAAREIMRQSGNMKQWPEGVPAQELFERDIARGESFVCMGTDGRPCATFAMIEGPDPTYARVVRGTGWSDEETPYMVVHRLASDGSHKGVLKAVLGFIRARSGHIRIDTHEDNGIMRHLLTREGFNCVGTIFLANGEERLAYEWKKR